MPPREHSVPGNPQGPQILPAERRRTTAGHETFHVHLKSTYCVLGVGSAMDMHGEIRPGPPRQDIRARGKPRHVSGLKSSLSGVSSFAPPVKWASKHPLKGFPGGLNSSPLAHKTRPCGHQVRSLPTSQRLPRDEGPPGRSHPLGFPPSSRSPLPAKGPALWGGSDHLSFCETASVLISPLNTATQTMSEALCGE